MNSQGAQAMGQMRASMAKAPVATLAGAGALVGLLLCLAAGVYLWQTAVVSERQRQMATFADQAARGAAADIANYLHTQNKKLDYFAATQSLSTALKYNDPVGRLEAQRALGNSFPGAVAIRLFSLEEAELNLTGNPPLRFAELDLINKAERRAAIVPEALSAGADQWYFNLARSVPADPSQPVVGTVLLSLPMDEIFKRLQDRLAARGRVSIYQTFNDQTRLVGNFGRGELYKAPRVSVPETPWEIEFTASEAVLAETHISLHSLIITFALVSFGLLAASTGIGWVLGKRLERRQERLLETAARMGRPAPGAAPVDLLDITVAEEDAELLGLAEGEPPPPEALDISDALDELAELDDPSVPAHIFRAYDIRGRVGPEIDNGFAYKVGQALGSEAQDKGESALVVARDARTHSPILTENLIRGILSTGCNVINIGTVPTPLLYFATETLETTRSGVMVTASHNGAAYNGFKVVMEGQPRTGRDIKAVRSRMLKGDFRHGSGQEERHDLVKQYIETIFSDVALAGEVRVVLDAGNGVAGKVAPELFTELGCEVIPLFCDLDGSFPNHGPDPSDEANLRDLIAKVKETSAQVGIAFDGDGDRLAVVTPSGQIIRPDRLLMLFAKDILGRNPGGDVVFDVKSSRLLNEVITQNGGRPIMWKTGHAPMRAKVMETGALIGGEFSGHIFIRERWYGFDDGLYAAARLVEIMSLRDEPLDEIFAEFPALESTPEYRIAVPEETKFELMERLAAEGDFGEGKIISLDGVRVEYPYGWGLARASNTAAEITLRFEAETPEQIHQLKARFTREIRNLDPSIAFQW